MRILVSGLILSFAAALSACGGGGAVANGNTANNQQANNQQANNQQVAQANSFYTIQNNSSYDIHYIHMSSTRNPNWGPDLLRSDQILGAGQAVQFNVPACDTYDLKLIDEDGDECEQRGVDICENTTLVINQADLLRCEGY